MEFHRKGVLTTGAFFVGVIPMREKLHISVPQPCSNRWENMSYVDETKRHCSSCSKVITDFTQMSDEQLIAYFRSNPVTCGMFAPHQLDRVMRTKRQQSHWIPALIIPALLAVTDVGAQETKTGATIEQQADTSKSAIRMPLADVFLTIKDSLVVTGSVLHSNDSLKEISMVGAALLFRFADGRTAGTYVDSSGNFEIRFAHRKIGDTVQAEVRMPGVDPYFTSLVLKEPAVVIEHHPPQLRRKAVVGNIETIITPPRSSVRDFFRRFW